ncbi:KGGVGR-motif variant AAA ATPase [Sphingomonas sp. YL-JM2C]
MMTFDQALPAMTRLILEILGDKCLATGLVLRDAAGTLTFVIRGNYAGSKRAQFDKRVRTVLSAYAELPSATPEELFDDSLKGNTDTILERVSIDETRVVEVRLIDRQIIGQDWTRPNFNPASSLPLLTFFSCKGGVGRSTALAIAASDFSARGKNVFIIDCDLEAPGLGSILLGSMDLPPYGLLDYLIENRMSGVSDDFLEQCLAPSPLTAGRGLIEVMPALGRSGQDSPGSTIPKLGRAYLSQSSNAAEPISYLKQMRSLIERLEKRGRSDVIFVNARSGLSESTAPAVIGLGGDVLLFGVNTPQTIECYGYLLAHLAKFVPEEDNAHDWRAKLRMIHAKAGRGEEAWRPYRELSYEIFAASLYEEEAEPSLSVFNFDIDDPEAPHFPWPIPLDADFAEFDPTNRRSSLQRDFYDRTFGSFVDRLFALSFPEESSPR